MVLLSLSTELYYLIHERDVYIFYIVGDWMKSAGIVVEYNPFHNGHAYHLQKTKEITNADIIIAVMSGNFLQRGEPALVSKFCRTKMALLAGVDIVVELPYPYATQKAEIFSNGAVSILGALGCESICFGSESGDENAFLETIQFMLENEEIFNDKVKKFIKEGYSYPKSTSLAFEALKPPSQTIDLSKPNNILGYHYLKAIQDQQLQMKAYTVQRKNANYHDENFSSATIASATSIRKALFEEKSLTKIQQYVPNTTTEELKQFYQKYQSFVYWENFWPFLKYRLLNSSPEELRNIYEVEEGLEYRLISCAKESETFYGFMELLKTKRYTWTRLQRACLHILTNTKKEEMKKAGMKAEYIRLLGMSQKGRKYLNQVKDDVSIPIISKISSYNKDLIHLDIKASNVYSLGLPSHSSQKHLLDEYRTPPIMI